MDRIIQIIVMTVTVAIAGVPNSSQTAPTYIGILYGHKIAAVRLVKVAGFTAVWLGASTRAPTWVQAGLTGSHPDAYIETGRNGRQVSLRRWSVPFGHLAHIRLRHVGSRWRVIIDGHHSRWMRLRRAISITVMETSGPAVAIINGKVVSGG